MKILSKINEKKGAKLWLLFFAFSAAALLILLLPFVVRGHHLIWGGQAADGITQHLTFLESIRKAGWLKAIGSYDFSLGLGADFLTSMSFMSFFDPFNVFVFILPFSILWVYDIIIVLKFIAAGAAMLAYLRWRKVKGGNAVAYALLYMLCGFVVYTFVRHLNLTSGAIYLPLMIMGLEQVYRKKNPFVFIGFSFLCLINSFYMFFFNSVFVVLYAFLYHAEACKTDGRAYWKTLIPSLWKIAAFYLVAIVLAGFMLLPNVYAYLHAARGGSKGLRWIDLKNVLLELLSFATPAVGSNYSAVNMNFLMLALGVAALAFCEKRTYAFRVSTTVLTIGLIVPLFGYFMNIFNYSNNRWSYLLSFCVLSMIGLQSVGENAEEVYPVPVRRKIAKVLFCWLGLVVVSACAFLMQTLFSGAFSVALKVFLTVLAVLFMLGGIWLIVWVLSKKSFLADRRDGEETHPPKILDNGFVRAIAKPSVLTVFSVPLALLFTLCYYIGYSAQHVSARDYAALFSSEEEYVSELNETGFFRTDVEAANTWWNSFNNRSVNNGYMGTVFYNSMNQESAFDFLSENEVYNPPQNLGMSGLDDRLALQSLLSVKYYYGKNGGYGFSSVAGYDGLFENENYVPFGFVYRNTVSKEYYESLDPLLRQYAMLSAMVAEGEGTTEAPALGELAELPITLSEKTAENFSLEKGDKIALTATGCAGKEIYIRFNHAAEVKETTEFSIGGNGKTRTYRFSPYGSNMYSNFRDPTICLGVSEADTLTVGIEMIQGRKISFDSVEVLGYSVADYQRAADALQKAPHLENVERSENAVAGEIALDEGGWMFFSLPYDSGWKAYVDGKEQPILRANSGFMAVELLAGGHTVELRYTTPYLKEGVLVTAVGLAAFAAVAICWAVGRIRGKRETLREIEK